MKRIIYLTILLGIAISLKAQSVLTLDSCRALAIANNKDLLISEQKSKAAYYDRKAAFTNYLPKVSATGAYLRNQKEISLLSNDQKHSISNLGTTASSQFQDVARQLAGAHPEYASLLQSIGEMDIATPLNNAGNSLVDALRTDSRNIWVGEVGITQPLYMGGKIRAYNKITGYAEEIAREGHDLELQEVILNTDEAYWLVVSLENKKKLAEGYLTLLKKLEGDIEKMIEEGVATKADGLTVKVRVNEAELSLTKVENGLTLSKMVLCQLCGIPLDTEIILVDIPLERSIAAAENPRFDMNQVYANRPEIRSLELAQGIYREKTNVARAEHLPTIALTGNYLVTNPSFYNGINNKFGGQFRVGVSVSVPIWQWGEGMYKVRSARTQVKIAEYQLTDAREKIELQVNQSAFQVKEAAKKLRMSESNLEKADENLRYATLGFEEGVIPPSNVLEAHTAWLSAQSEKIDAQIDVRLTKLYLDKSTGTLKK
ncbi:MAG: TolC family protein [Bacteroides sp.]|nr:TolC family protein [Bacteroides sp.]